VNQFVAVRRRASVVSAVVTLTATAALLSGLLAGRACAQTEPKPAEPVPAAAEKAAAPAGKPAKAPKAAKAPKPAKPPEPSLEQQRSVDGVYAKHSNWLSLRIGYAKRTGDLNGDGSVAYGVGYAHMMTNKYAFAAGLAHEIVGHFGSQIDEAVPFTAEFQRHYKWNSSVRPYLGLGGGFYFRKFYRTGGEYNTTTTGGPHVSHGFTSAIDQKHVLGLETRVARIQGRPGVVNPTFGPGQETETIWTVKLSWALVY
jgi:hypothetical protein